MRVSAPTFAVTPDRVVVTARFESDQLTGAHEVELVAPRSLLGRIDVSATPFVPLGTILAAALAEDVEFDAPADPVTVAGARAIAESMTGWWAGAGWRPPAIRAPIAAPLPADDTRGHGLFFCLGVDSWASLLALRDTAAADRPLTYLLTIEGTDHRAAEVQAAVMANTRRAASEVGLPLVELSTNARDVLDLVASWEQMHGAVLASFALLLAPLLARVTFAGSHSDANRPPWGSHVDLDHQWSSSSLRIDHHLGHMPRVDKVAALAGDQLALDSLFVCWEGGGATNCGTCPKCLRTMTGLELADALGLTSAFPHTVDPAAVTAARHDADGFVAELVDRLPPGPLRVAWQSHLTPDKGTRRLEGIGGEPLVGPDAVTRVNLALWRTGWQVRASGPDTAGPDTAGPDTAGPDPAGPDPAGPDPAGADPDGVVDPAGQYVPREPDAVLSLGWGPGEVPLRPALGDHRAIRETMADHEGRPVSWLVADFADPQRVNDPGPAALADRAEQAWGPGLCYLAGIAWADTSRPVIGDQAVARLMGAARVRLWWHGGVGLDPIRLLESIEHGCLPLQVMPRAAAVALRHRLPEVLASIVIDPDQLTLFDISADATSELLHRAADLVLAGSADRDLGLEAALQWSAE